MNLHQVLTYYIPLREPVDDLLDAPERPLDREAAARVQSLAEPAGQLIKQISGEGGLDRYQIGMAVVSQVNRWTKDGVI
jgi:hypothetical protein